MKKSKRVKRPAKKSSKAPAGGVVIRKTLEMSLSKKKEKMTVKKRKGIYLLSEVALTEEAQYEEVRKKSLRNFHKTHLSGSVSVTKTAPSAAKIKPSITNEGTGKDEDDSNNEQDFRSKGSDQERVNDDDNTQYDSEKGSDSEHETNENESDSKSDQKENEKEIGDDKEDDEDEFVRPRPTILMMNMK
nr:hypothetical protein [Tanacetum cinerariifolium]